MYDATNIFARIIKGEIPCQKVFENDHVLAFRDIHPKAPVHILVIPKGAYTNIVDFYGSAPEIEISAFARAVAQIARDHKIDETGFRTIANTGVNGGQEVPHFHVHLLGGKPIGPMVTGG
ncbi:MAG: histidine triad nucleotide-binding protein [Pseudobdellovibrionaceae bacterium]